jgi:hypothetical protein
LHISYTDLSAGGREPQRIHREPQRKYKEAAENAEVFERIKLYHGCLLTTYDQRLTTKYRDAKFAKKRRGRGVAY